jgi:hypothetical protein
MAPTAAQRTKDRAEKARIKKLDTQAKAGGYTDANHDGIADRDKLDPNVLADQYGYSANVINSDPELLQIFTQAADEDWQSPKLEAEIKSSNWFKNNNEYHRAAWVAEKKGGADWEAIKEQALLAIKKAQVAAGSNVDPSMLVKRYIYEGWDKPGREQLLKSALTSGLDSKKGWTSTFEQNLQNASYKAGVTYSPEWYLSAAKSVNDGLSSPDTWLNDIQEKSSGLYPAYADKIRAGVSVRDIASPYINQMADILEMSPENISMNDPYIKQALGSMSPDGTPQVMSLWDFQQKIKKDPRWMETTNAGNDMSKVANDILQKFGMVG